MPKKSKLHRAELRRAAREFFAMVRKGREVTHAMIRDGVNALVPHPASENEITSLIGYLVDNSELRARHDEDAEQTFYKFV